jgi:hypothetical protein
MRGGGEMRRTESVTLTARGTAGGLAILALAALSGCGAAGPARDCEEMRIEMGVEVLVAGECIEPEFERDGGGDRDEREAPVAEPSGDVAPPETPENTTEDAPEGSMTQAAEGITGPVDAPRTATEAVSTTTRDGGRPDEGLDASLRPGVGSETLLGASRTDGDDGTETTSGRDIQISID